LIKGVDKRGLHSPLWAPEIQFFGVREAGFMPILVDTISQSELSGGP